MAGKRKIDLTGQVFGERIVLRHHHGNYWEVMCSCGEIQIVRMDALKEGKSNSCGCKKRDKQSLIGQRFGNLVVAYFIGSDAYGDSIWGCECDCGNLTTGNGRHLKAGKKISCGCLIGKGNISHGKSDKPIYRVLAGLLRRCYDCNSTGYENYGGRGIRVCDEWYNNRESFFVWAEESGYTSGLSIERINNDGPYSPENCRWATPAEQSRNKRSNIIITFNGVTMHIIDWARSLGVSPATIYWRYKQGLSIEHVLSSNSLISGKKLKQFKI